ncbi:MAG TPA: SRPBCC domain-containing protein, partial [Vicinamibacterales bacterium]|nr:SRPBCC domain-containing protein [Vicinamibacterales bacterium]
MKRKHHGRVIDTSIRVNTTPMRAWEAWADPQHIANWFVDRAEGKAEAGATMKWFFEAFNYALDVPIVEAEPGRTFVTGGGPHPGSDGLPYLMEITIEKDGDATVVNLVNSGFSEKPEKDRSFKDTESGWQCALTTMKTWLERYPELRRRRTILMRPAADPHGRLHALYATADGRSKWLPPDA